MSQKAQTLALVRKLIDRRTEDKFISWENAPGGTTTTGRAVGSSGSVIQLVNEIQEGPASYQRLGDKIRPKYLLVKGFVAINNTVPVETAARVRLMVVSNKSQKNGNPLIAGGLPLGALLNDNLVSLAPSVAHNYRGYPDDDNSMINTEQFIVHGDKHYDLIQAGKTPAGNPPILGTGAMSVYRYFKFKVKCPASFNFTDPNGDWVTNFSPFLLMGYSYPEGWGFPPATPDPLAGQVRIYARSTLFFEDA